MRYRSSTALEDSAPGGSVAGARMAMNGAPWWTTLGDDGGRNNNVVVQKNLGPRAFFTKKIILCQIFCAMYVGSRSITYLKNTIKILPYL